ncbi:hypothetical protein [Neoactinobaculum massilliense]|uniref:hypothetical protein n=1 Tax=Neoactinobaculum massilliense TaxID=2364794 RepID=UPI000F52151B|nr:hypothetical protein [Neoactinobaculum massilliense]
MSSFLQLPGAVPGLDADVPAHFGRPGAEQRNLGEGRAVVDLGIAGERVQAIVGAGGIGLRMLGMRADAAARIPGTRVELPGTLGEGTSRYCVVLVDDAAAPAALEAGLEPAGMLAWEAERVREVRPRLLRPAPAVDVAHHAVRRLYLEGHEADLPATGTPVTVEATATRVGTVTTAVRDWEDGPVALAVVRTDVPLTAILTVGEFRAAQEEVDRGL